MERHNKHGINDKEIFKNKEDYWQVADNIRDIYMSDGSLATLLDFERVLDEVDIYAFKNWEIGELVAGPARECGAYAATRTARKSGQRHRPCPRLRPPRQRRRRRKTQRSRGRGTADGTRGPDPAATG